MEPYRFRIRISVVEYGSVRMFEHQGIRNTALHAENRGFEGGRLSVMRSGQVIDRSDPIEERGTHCACLCFCGFRCGGDGKRVWAVSSVVSDDYEVGDILLIDTIDCPVDFAHEPYPQE